MKVLLFGANGQLGSDLNKIFRAAGDNVVALTHAQVDVCDEAKVGELLAAEKPEVVLNTAAFHKVEECEKKPELAFQVNASAPMRLAVACQKSGAVLVHFSTDYAFGGYAHDKPFEEADRPAPLNVYGVSKVAGEELIAYNTDRYFVLRVCGLYGIAGSSGKGGNFVENMLKKALAGDPIKVVDDQVLTPTYTVDLAEAVRKLVLSGNFGLYHLSSEGQCSWYEFTRQIFEFAGVKANLSACKTSDFYSPVKRPAYSVLSKAKLRSVGLSIPSWQDALPRYLKERERKNVGVTA
ncbi:MAG TPA: dTDP-4-dehydrorhamnose reductase [Terriglobales bacterium]|nr:dTDP-4-dehydrorhamnose reductase [Terriglobales bacterium]